MEVEALILVSHPTFTVEEGLWWGWGAYMENLLPVQKSCMWLKGAFVEGQMWIYLT